MTMASEIKSSNSKKRSAAYYREYRRRRKENLAPVIPLPGLADGNKSVRANTLNTGRITYMGMPGSEAGSRSWEYSRNRLANLFLLFFVVVMTGLLVHLSAPFYMKTHQSPLMAYTLAAVVELSLLFLVTLKVNGVWEKLAKPFLIVALSAYALLPIALNPIFEAQNEATVAHVQSQQTRTKDPLTSL